MKCSFKGFNTIIVNIMVYLYQSPSFDHYHFIQILYSNYFLPIYRKQINSSKIKNKEHIYMARISTELV